MIQAHNKIENIDEIKRSCYKCGSPLNINHAYLNAFRLGFNEIHFNKLWNSNYIEFYCCRCYKEFKKIKKKEKKNIWLINKAKRICNKFGINLIINNKS